MGQRSSERDFLGSFLGLYLHDPAVGLLRAAEARLVAPLKLPAPMLDLGTGDGSFSARVLGQPAAVGVDRDPRRLARARASGAYRFVVVADAHRLPFRDGVFASVLSNSTLEHIPGAGDVLRECARVLRPAGTLAFTLHNQRFARRMFFWPWLFSLLGQSAWTERYRSARLRRLAMANLLSESEWRALLDECGFASVSATGYLSGRAESAFETLLVVSRFGLGRANVGSALRTVCAGLDRAGLNVHRRLAGWFLSRALGGVATDSEGEPAAMLVVAQAPACAQASVVELAARRRSG